MFTRLHQKKGTAILEYTALLVIVMMAILFLQKYIVRGFAGRWKEVGDTFGHGRQYDPLRTTECVWSEDFGIWYEPQCYDNTFPSSFESCYNDCVENGGWGSCVWGAPPGDCGFGPGEGCCRLIGSFYYCISGCHDCCYFSCQIECYEYATQTCADAGAYPCQ